ncbi:TPR domain protein [Alteromonas sp. 38]|uniref:tetratricopeptide repeat protein n=1 Tax=Alteromonas TaxID=226 RepID=UPI0012F06773|nr:MULTISPECIES: tetratricopeptide repeat protein [Alteromonas]CAD5258722.1 TPR domain protein [Alteromonas sp. 154]VXC36441.1 TPR domain protein [Alteromonas sp. 38]
MLLRQLIIALLVLFSSAMLGCASTAPVVAKNPYPALHDHLFPSYASFPIETEEEVFALEEDAQLFVDEAVFESGGKTTNVKGLISSIFDHSEMGLLYRSNANSIASETFYNRSANCLSLSIMTYAMAQYAGYDATFYEVDIPEYWTRRDGFSFLNGHVNLTINVPKNPLVTNIGPSRADVDFDPQMIRTHFPRVPVTKRLVLSMFYNNKGADALIANSYTRAYSYFRAAAVLSPELQQSWVNLGVLYRMVDAFEAAEQSYRFALNIDEKNLTAWDNLSILYYHQGLFDKSAEIKARVEAQRKENPFYHFILGEQALDDGEFADALEHFQRALRLDNTRHEVLFGLAKSYYELGDINNAERYIKRAIQFAPNSQDENRYMSKLSTIARNY